MDTHVTDCCALFYNATGIPVSFFCADGQVEVSYPFRPVSIVTKFSTKHSDKNPDVRISPSQGMHGKVALADGSFVLMGPAYSVPITEEIIRAYMQEEFIPFEQEETARALLYAASDISYIRFLQNLTFLYYCLTGEFIDPASHFGLYDAERDFELRVKQTKQLISAKENREKHGFLNAYLYEKQLYALVKEGDMDRLHSFLAENGTANCYLGTLADSPLRQAKDLFILTVSKLTVLSAIPGKLDVELTYTLMDSYIQECENAMTLAEVERLLFIMLTDFCRRIGTCKTPNGISSEMYRCMCYIREHTNENISISDVAAFIKRSVSYLQTHFKKEVGTSIGAYITQCKLEDAAHLLIYSDNSLAAISSYLCFSSQSYFQNVFKKQYGATPLQYRTQNQT